MKTLDRFKLTLVCIPFIGLAACGGGNDLEDRLDVADPAVRFVDASAASPNLTLYKTTTTTSTPQSNATNVAYTGASDYFDVGTDNATWTVGTSPTTLTTANTVGSVVINPQRGTLDTVVAYASSATTTSVALIVDPFNKPLNSTSTRVRLFNGSYNIGAVDVYLNPAGGDITAPTATPAIAGVTVGTAGPVSGNDSINVPGASYTITVTATGTKTILFRGTLAFGANQDVLLVTVPDATTNIQVLEKVEGVPNTVALPAAAT